MTFFLVKWFLFYEEQKIVDSNLNMFPFESQKKMRERKENAKNSIVFQQCKEQILNYFFSTVLPFPPY